MPDKKYSSLDAIKAIIIKDLLSEFRTRYAISAFVMFALITLSSVSMSLGSVAMTSELLAVLLWVILFFCAMAGLARGFVQEQEAGTLFTLRVYARPQAVFFGKLFVNQLMLIGLTGLVVPLFVIFLNVDIFLWFSFMMIVFLGQCGIAAASTLTAAMVAKTQGKGSLFAVLTFPVLLPQFLAAISATGKVLAGTLPVLQDYIFLAGYPVVMVLASSILFDYLWYD